MENLTEQQLEQINKDAYDFYCYFYQVAASVLEKKYAGKIDYETAKLIREKFIKKNEKRKQRDKIIKKIPLVKQVWQLYIELKWEKIEDGSVAKRWLKMMDALKVNELTTEDIKTAIANQDIYTTYFKEEFEAIAKHPYENNPDTAETQNTESL